MTSRIPSVVTHFSNTTSGNSGLTPPPGTRIGTHSTPARRRRGTEPCSSARIDKHVAPSPSC
eukprot:2908262-Lingulodinium_polyedra.AAC.1